MNLVSRPAHGVSAWRLICEELRREISDGVHPAGGKLPAESELAERFGVHRNTVRQAIAALARDGFVVSRRGSGTYVTDRAVMMYRIGTRTRLSTGLATGGGVVPGELLDSEVVEEPPAEVDERLALDGRPAQRLETRRRVDGVVITRGTHWFGLDLTAGLAPAFRRSGSITASLGEVGIADYVRASTVIGARIATAEEAADMELEPGSVVLAVRSLDTLPDGTALQTSLTRFRADRIELDVEHHAQ